MFSAPNAALWALLRPLARLILRLRLHVTAPLHRARRPFVLLCNHASYYDPLLAAVCVDRPLRFAGAEPAPRRGFLLRLSRGLCLPETLSLDEALRQAAGSGQCVGLFPEGERCLDGATGAIPGDLAEKLRASGLDLVTLRLSGGYFTAPRWADRIPRRGRLRAKIVRTLSAGVMQGMEKAELQALIEQDLWEDACATARKHPAPYRGERRAERLEKLLYICPKCGSLSGMESRDDRFGCRDCGFSTVFTLGGGFRGGGVPFADIRQWGRWQDERLRMLCGQAGEGALLEDGGCELYALRGGDAERIGSGGLHLYRDRLELPTGVAIPTEDILRLRLRGSSSLLLESRRGSRFEVSSIRPLCAAKYVAALDILKEIGEKERGQDHEQNRI